MLEVERLHVEYATQGRSVVAVHAESFTVAAGEFFTLLGPSGCGKTTTLRSIAGLETPTTGAIRIAGTAVFDSARGIAVPTHARDISMVFQSYAIWPHMSVLENVAFPLRVRGMAAADLKARVMQTLQLVGLGELAQRPATQLSGGQQQRVALARAIVKDAKLLLLDEPLSNLDAKLREQMRRELRTLQRRLGTTSIYVTHDQDEALALSDRIAVMNGGRIVEIGTPSELYLQPRHAFTARFIGQAELLPCTPVAATGAGARVATALGELTASVHAEPGRAANHLLIRPEHVRFVNGAAPAENVIDGRISGRVFSGRLVEYDVDCRGGTLAVHETSGVVREVGSAVQLHLPPERCVLVSET